VAYGKILTGTPAAANSGMPTPTDVLQNWKTGFNSDMPTLNKKAHFFLTIRVHH
jgi:hypothetical protein